MFFALVYLLSIFLFGLLLVLWFLKGVKGDLKIFIVFILGFFFSGWSVFALCLIFSLIFSDPILPSVSLFSFLTIVAFFLNWRKIKSKTDIKIIVLYILFLLFSFYLFFHTFSYNYKEKELKIASLVWSDFAFHIPLIRSFSLGQNFPPESPLFSNQQIRYHFLFDFQAGVLENLGMPVDWALNIPSVFSFTSLLILIFYLGKDFFGSKKIGILAVFFFLFNSSLSFLKIINRDIFSLDFIKKILGLSSFLSFGPYDRKSVISAFWSLNIFTNQRHLSFAFSIALLVFYIFLENYKTKKKLENHKKIFLIFLIGFLPFWHSQVFFSIGLVLLGFFVFFPGRKETLKLLFFSGALAIWQIIWFRKGLQNENIINLRLGYLVENLTVISFLKYWFLNLGISPILMIVSLFWLPKSLKKFFFAISGLFIVPNLVQFSPEIAANHKFFNLWLILANFYTAYFLINVLIKIVTNKIIRSVILSILFFFLTFSGFLDMIVITNNGRMIIADSEPKNKLTAWVKKSTKPKSIFLTNYDVYHPVSLAGRKIIFGWPYFSWSSGYETDSRFRLIEKLYSANIKKETIRLLKENKIDYVVIDINQEKNIPYLVNKEFFLKSFPKVFEDNNFLVFEI